MKILFKIINTYISFVGIEMKFKNMLYHHIIIANMIPELSEITLEENGLTIGAAATINEIEIFLRALNNSVEGKQAWSLK